MLKKAFCSLTTRPKSLSARSSLQGRPYPATSKPPGRGGTPDGHLDVEAFMAAMDAADDAIYLVEPETVTFVDVNDGACRLHALTRAELMAIGPTGLLGQPASELQSLYRKVIEAAEPVEPVVVMFVRPGREVAWMEIRRRAVPWRGKWLIVTFSRDVTKAHVLNQKLSISHGLITRLSQQLPGAIFQYRLRADGAACIPFASNALIDILGVRPTREFSPAETVWKAVAPEYYEELFASLASSADDLREWHQEFEVILPGAGRQWREAKAKPERLADGSTLWHGFISDAGDKKRFETKLIEQRDRLRNVLNSLPMHVALLDKDGALLETNRNTLVGFRLGHGREERSQPW